MLLRKVDQKKCRSKVSLTSVNQKCGSEVLLTQKCRSDVLPRSVAQKCQFSKQCCSEVSFRSVDEQCGSEVLVRSVAQNCG